MTTLKLTPEIERYIYEARRARLRQDQFERFLKYGYVAIEGMLPFHAMARDADVRDQPNENALGGKRGPGKSHAIMAQMGLDDMQRAPGLKGLFIRKIRKSAKESLTDLAGKVFKRVAHKIEGDEVIFPNTGGRILMGGYNNDTQIDNFLGLEYDIIAIEELTHLHEDKYRKLLGSLRTSKDYWRPRCYASTNADGVGLSFFKRDFVMPARLGVKGGRTSFLDVSNIYNPYLNEEYNQWLDTLSGALRSAWRDGNWDAFESAAFPTWDFDAHVCDPFPIPEHWPKWRAIDWGSYAPLCCLWFAKDPDTQRTYIYKELYQAGLHDRQAARIIKEMTTPEEHITVTYGDPNSFYQEKNYENQVYTAAKEYAKEGVIISKADNNRIEGKRKFDGALDPLPDGLPGLMIFSTCPDSIRTIPELPRDPKSPEDVDTDAEDHAYDAARYGLTNAPKQKPKAPPTKRRLPYAGMRSM